MQHRLDIAYDDYLYETSWSLRVSRPVLLLAATSGFNEVIEFGSFVVCQLAGDEHQLVTYDSVAGCMLRNDGRFSLAHHGRQRSASHEFERACEMCRASYSE
jgi:hypothetical protein